MILILFRVFIWAGQTLVCGQGGQATGAANKLHWISFAD